MAARRSNARKKAKRRRHAQTRKNALIQAAANAQKEPRQAGR